MKNRANQKPVIAIHGGYASELTMTPEMIKTKRLAMAQIIDKSYKYVESGHNAVETALYTIKLLEDNPLFNAGFGAIIQKDGNVRLSASLMTGKDEKFASIAAVQNIKHPSELVHKLWQQPGRTNTSLAGSGADDFARENNVPILETNTIARIDEWSKAFGQPLDNTGKYTGTVGCVISMPNGEVVAMTSTGGTPMSRTGRVGDSATPAGNYANEHVAVSMTGTGEEITNYAIASSIGSLVKHAKMSTEEAVKTVLSNAKNIKAGAIVVDKDGKVICSDTQKSMIWARHQGNGVEVSTYDPKRAEVPGEDRPGEIFSEQQMESIRKIKFAMPSAPLPVLEGGTIKNLGPVENKSLSIVK